MTSGTSAVLPRVYVYDTLRTAHLERAATTSATYLYRHRSYDWDDDAARAVDARQLGTGMLVCFLLARSVGVLEVNEPLMRPGVIRAAAACVSVRISDLVRRRHTRVVTYAIDNRDPFRSDDVTGLRSRTRRALDRWAAGVVWRSVDRVAFGTSAARTAYTHALPPLSAGSSSRDIMHLPVACQCNAEVSESGRRSRQVVFVGALNDRKGVAQLLAAWPLVRQAVPHARLAFLGKGDLEANVRAASEAALGIELFADPPRARIHEALRSSRVAVLFSQPRPRWREQVGLPIVEALAHGCQVVTSDQTGLAPWLTANGHTVLAADASPAQLAGAIAAAIEADRSPVEIIAALPDSDGRTAAENWLFA